MDELSETFSRTFTLYKNHMDYLMNIDSNLNSAMRKCLDRLIKEDGDKSRHKVMFNISNSLIIIALGLLFLFFGMSTPVLVDSLFLLIFSGFLIIFGISLGVMSYKV